jgi:hypothetical protein
MIRFTLTLCAVLLIACGSRGRGDLQAPVFDKRDPPPASTPASSTPNEPPKPTALAEPATVGSSCAPVSLIVRESDPPVEVRFKLRASSDGDVVDQLIVSRTQPTDHQTLQVSGMDALSVLNKCSVRAQDIDFDGYNDLVVDVRAGAANTYAQYWRYDPAAGSFVSLGEYPEFRLDAPHKRLKTYERNGSGGLEYESREYAFEQGKLVLEKQETQTAIEGRAEFQRTVFVRRGPDMKMVKRELIHPKSTGDRAE